MNLSKETYEQAAQLMADHELDELHVNCDGHFFINENPALMSVGMKKEKVRKLQKHDVASQLASFASVEMLEQETSTESESEPEASGNTDTPEEQSLVTAIEQFDIVLKGEVIETTPAVVPTQSNLFEATESTEPATKVVTGNPESPEERGEQVEKPVAKKSKKAAKAATEKGA